MTTPTHSHLLPRPGGSTTTTGGVFRPPGGSNRGVKPETYDHTKESGR